MRPVPFTRIRNFVIILAFMVFSLGIGYRLGERGVRVGFDADRGVIIDQETPDGVNVDFSLFWDVWQRLFRYHIDSDTFVPQRMFWGAIRGMVASLEDPYTTFLTPTENDEFKQDLGGSFEGIGAQLGLEDNRVIIVTPLEGNPAELAGLRAGDWIIEVDGVDTTGWTIPQAVNEIRGPKGSTVILTVLHEGDLDPVEVPVVRDTIYVPFVESWVKTPSEIEEIVGLEDIDSLLASPERVAYIRLSRFGDTTNDDWRAAVDEVLAAMRTQSSIGGLILDLRNNPGGYLEGSVFIASEFVDDGTIVSQENSDGSRDVYDVNRSGKLLDIPVVILVNRGSASAAEIVAGALKDYGRATIVGEQTFGKGSVQTPQELPKGAGLHVTTGKWLLPGGTSIDKEGITPDIAVDNPREASGDAQLAKAVELLLQ